MVLVRHTLLLQNYMSRVEVIIPMPRLMFSGKLQVKGTDTGNEYIDAHLSDASCKTRRRSSIFLKKTKHEVTFIASQILSNIYCMLYLTEMKVRPRFVSQNDGHFPLAPWFRRSLRPVRIQISDEGITVWQPFANVWPCYDLHGFSAQCSSGWRHANQSDESYSCRRQKEFSFPVVNFVFVIGTSLTY